MPFLNQINLCYSTPNGLKQHSENTVGLMQVNEWLLLSPWWTQGQFVHFKYWVNWKVSQKQFNIHVITVLVAKNTYVWNLAVVPDASFYFFPQHLEIFSTSERSETRQILAVWFQTQLWFWQWFPKRKWCMMREPETPLDLEKALK